MLGAILGGLSSLAGGFLNSQSAKDQMAMQMKFAKNAIQWKAADAEKAGISKLYAMGAPTMSYSPVSTGMGNAVSMAGQNIGRAIDAYTGPSGKIGTIQAEIGAAQLDGLKIDNEIKRTELLSRQALATQPGTGPGIADSTTTSIMGQGDSLGGRNSPIKLQKDLEPVGHTPEKSYGVNPEVSMYKTREGWAPQIPKDLQEAFESDDLGRWQWNYRNKFLPMLPGEEHKTTPFPLNAEEKGAGYFWTYDPLTGQYILVPPRGNPNAGAHRALKWEYMMDRLRR